MDDPQIVFVAHNYDPTIINCLRTRQYFHAFLFALHELETKSFNQSIPTAVYITRWLGSFTQSPLRLGQRLLQNFNELAHGLKAKRQFQQLAQQFDNSQKSQASFNQAVQRTTKTARSLCGKVRMATTACSFHASLSLSQQMTGACT